MMHHHPCLHYISLFGFELPLSWRAHIQDDPAALSVATTVPNLTSSQGKPRLQVDSKPFINDDQKPIRTVPIADHVFLTERTNRVSKKPFTSRICIINHYEPLLTIITGPVYHLP